MWEKTFASINPFFGNGEGICIFGQVILSIVPRYGTFLT